MSLAVDLAFLLVGFLLLLKGADSFVSRSASIARKMGVSEFIIGLTVVAIGTSVPELASSVAAAFSGSSSIILGNVIGSNIANLALIIGLAALLAPLVPQKAVFLREGYLLMAITVFVSVFLLLGVLEAWHAGILLLLYLAYTLFLFEDAKRFEKFHPFAGFVRYFVSFGFLGTAKTLIFGKSVRRKSTESMKGDLFIAFTGLVGVVFGARWLINSSISIASSFNLSEELIGATIIAIGTSLPELLVTVSAARKNMASLALGNVIGSNIANLLLILGVSGLITPLVSTPALVFPVVAMLVVTMLFLVVLRTNWRLSRLEGVLLLACYAGFILFSVL